jgi:hypothetical protein
MNADFRQSLLAMQSCLERLEGDAEAILAEPGDIDKVPIAEELCELIADMQAKVAAKLDGIADA